MQGWAFSRIAERWQNHDQNQPRIISIHLDDLQRSIGGIDPHDVKFWWSNWSVMTIEAFSYLKTWGCEPTEQQINRANPSSII